MGRRAYALLLCVLLLFCGCRGEDSEVWTPVAAEGYTAEQIGSYFAQIAFSSEYGGYRGSICKWTDRIVCYVSGDYAEGEMVVLTDLAERLNAIPGFPGVRITEDEAEAEEANFTMQFVMQGELRTIFGEDAASSSGMSRFYWTKKGGEIVRAETGIAANITPMNAKASVICEEFLQAMGLSSDSYDYPESIFYEGYNGALRPSPIDWALLELLYHESVTPGMSEEDAMRQVRLLLGLAEE